GSAEHARAQCILAQRPCLLVRWRRGAKGNKEGSLSQSRAHRRVRGRIHASTSVARSFRLPCPGPRAYPLAAMRPLSVAAPLVGALLLFASSPSLAQDFPTLRDVSSVRSAGMGDATRGFASSSEAILLNPAGIAANVRFNIDAQ